MLAHVIRSSPVAQRFSGAASETLPTQRSSAAHLTRTGLPDALKANAEARSGVLLDDVKVHCTSAKPSHRQALAYAQGSNIYLAPGQDQHLPHETGHVVQQKKGLVVATRHLNGVALNDDPRLEAQADGFGRDMARQGGIAQRKPVVAPIARPVAQAVGWRDLIGGVRPTIVTILRRLAITPRALPHATNAAATQGAQIVGTAAGPVRDVARTAAAHGLSTTDGTLAWRILQALASLAPRTTARRAAIALPVIGGMTFAFYRAGLHRRPLFRPIVPLIRVLSGNRLGGGPLSSTTLARAPAPIGYQQQRRGFSTQAPGRDKGSRRQAPLNRAAGAAFEDKVDGILAMEFPGAKKARNVTVRYKGNRTKVRLDFLVLSNGAYWAFEAKGSPTASYTKNQTVIFALMDYDIVQTGTSSVELRSDVPILGIKAGETIAIHQLKIYRHKGANTLQPTNYTDDIER